MSDDAPKPKKRLPVRWLTLAEIVGVSAVVIAGLGYWDTHRERMSESRERAAAERAREAEAQAQAKAGAMRLSFLMTGAASDSGGRLRLTPTHPEHVIQTQTLVFPTEVRADPVETTGNPRIEGGWFARGLAKATRKRKADEGRLPVGIVTTYVDAGLIRTDRAIYQIGYRAEDRLLRGDRVEMEGLSLARRAGSENLQAAVDALWARSAPPPKG